MSIGMTYEDFWYSDVRLVEFYRKADELKTKRRNETLWLQGAYFYEALCDASPLFRMSFSRKAVEPRPYVKEPYPMTELELREREQREAKKREERMKAEFARFVNSMIERKKLTEAHKDKGG